MDAATERGKSVRNSHRRERAALAGTGKRGVDAVVVHNIAGP